MNQDNTQTTAAQAPAVPEDHIVTTKHSAVIRGQALDYVATTSTMVVKTAGKKCEIFFTAYTMEGFKSASERPLNCRLISTHRPFSF